MLLVVTLTTIPTLLYVWLLWWLDRYEKEPLSLLVAVFFWGAVPAVALALLAESDVYAAPFGRQVATSVWLAPLVEEPLKALALVGIFIFFRYEFDGILDGIIYGSLIGFGFSMSENALYFYREGGALSSLLWSRIILFGFNHALYTSIVGVTLGLIRYDKRSWIGWIAFPGSLLLAMAFHALHNEVSGYHFPGVLLAWVIDSSGVFVVVLVAVIAWRHEQHWIESELIEEVQHGLISFQMYEVIHSSQRRVQEQWNALTHGGWLAFRATRKLHHLLTELAFLKYQLRIGDCYCRPQDIESLRTQILELTQDHAPASASSIPS